MIRNRNAQHGDTGCEGSHDREHDAPIEAIGQRADGPLHDDRAKRNHAHEDRDLGEAETSGLSVDGAHAEDRTVRETGGHGPKQTER